MMFSFCIGKCWMPASARHSHSIMNKPIKANSDAGFPVVISVDTMNNTIVRIVIDIFC